MFETLGILMRWLHIASVATLVGGMLYGWLVLVPATGVLAAEARKALVDKAAALYRPLVFGAIAALLVSGGYNLAVNPGHHPRYYILLGLKLLLVAHVFAVGEPLGVVDENARQVEHSRQPSDDEEHVQRLDPQHRARPPSKR